MENQFRLPDIANGEDKSSPFVNRIRKNYRHLKKWAKKTSTDCFRIYDRDIREYPLSIDFYAGKFCIYYYARGSVSAEPAEEVVLEVEAALQKIFGIECRQIVWKTRARTKETRQYEKLDHAKEYFTVVEYGVKFLVNLRDYLDTGLFFDHRETRQLVARQMGGKKLLNLFAYTCSFSVHAAAAGASFTKSVDMSNTYTAWGRKNFQLNDLSSKENVIVRADCLRFLDEETKSGEKYDVIIIDPPTISRSKKMAQLFDIQKDYIVLLQKSVKLLTNAGLIFFSTNSRKFQLDEKLFPECNVIEMTAKTIPIDFHDKMMHRCWKFVKKGCQTI